MPYGFTHTQSFHCLLQVAENFVPPLLGAVLQDYKRNVPSAREPEVLSTMATIVNHLESHITKEIPEIFDAVFECTLDMINKDFEEYPEHRTNFFLLLQAVNSHCFAGLYFEHLLPSINLGLVRCQNYTSLNSGSNKPDFQRLSL